MERLAIDLDDVLATIPLVQGNAALSDRLFDRLVHLLLEASVRELNLHLAAGKLTGAGYDHELRCLAQQCRKAGLLPV